MRRLILIAPLLLAVPALAQTGYGAPSRPQYRAEQRMTADLNRDQADRAADYNDYADRAWADRQRYDRRDDRDAYEDRYDDRASGPVNGYASAGNRYDERAYGEGNHRAELREQARARHGYRGGAYAGY